MPRSESKKSTTKEDIKELFDDLKGFVCGENNDKVLLTMNKSTYEKIAYIIEDYQRLLKWKHDLEFEYSTLHQSDFENYSYAAENYKKDYKY